MAQSYGEANGLTVVMDGPFGSITTGLKISQITMTADAWKGAVSPYSQEVELEGVSANSLVDLNPNVSQITLLGNLGIAMVAENDAGKVTVHSIGGKPKSDMTMQVAIREVVAV